MKKPTNKPSKPTANPENEFFKKLGIPPFKKPVPDDGFNKKEGKK